MAYGFTTTTTNTNDSIQKLIEQFTAKETESRASNIKRREAITSIFDEVIARYGPGGTYGASAEAMLERQKVRDVGATAQRDISRGLYGIRPYEQEWEATTGAPARLRLEDIKMERLSSAQLGKAGFLEGIQEPYPDYNALMQSISAGAGVGGGGGATTAAWGSPGSLTSLPGREGTRDQGVTGSRGAKADADYIRPDIQMGPGFGPAFEGYGAAGTGVGAGEETEKKAPQTASLINRYTRFKKKLKRQGIQEGSIAPYEVWYKANVGSKAFSYGQ